jgi:hypothetical protein
VVEYVHVMVEANLGTHAGSVINLRPRDLATLTNCKFDSKTQTSRGVDPCHAPRPRVPMLKSRTRAPKAHGYVASARAGIDLRTSPLALALSRGGHNDMVTFEGKLTPVLF